MGYLLRVIGRTIWFSVVCRSIYHVEYNVSIEKKGWRRAGVAPARHNKL